MFPDDAACAKYLEEAQWQDGFICPRCNQMGVPYRIANRPLVLRCRKCPPGYRIDGLTRYKPRRTSGSEHLVYIKDKRVYKRTKSGKYGQKHATPDQYMERLALMNKICPPLDSKRYTEHHYSVEAKLS